MYRRRDLVFYDGTCGFCHATVRFLLGRDRDGRRFAFAPIGGDAFGEAFPDDFAASLPDTLIALTPAGDAWVKSDAICYLLRRCGQPWPVAGGVLHAVPTPLRDAAYDVVARFRRAFFAPPANWCPAVPESLQRRFLS